MIHHYVIHSTWWYTQQIVTNLSPDCNTPFSPFPAFRGTENVRSSWHASVWSNERKPDEKPNSRARKARRGRTVRWWWNRPWWPWCRCQRTRMIRTPCRMWSLRSWRWSIRRRGIYWWRWGMNDDECGIGFYRGVRVPLFSRFFLKFQKMCLILCL